MVTLYTMRNCPYCVKAKNILTARQIAFQETLVELDDEKTWSDLEQRSGMKTMPQIFHNDKLIGGCSDLEDLDRQDGLASLR